MRMTDAAIRYYAAFKRHYALYERLHHATGRQRREIRAQIRQAEEELDSAQTAYAREAPWAFSMLPEDGRD